ncbi:MAG: hypothetical protein IJW23_06180 [Lentisphaeria bacterium]|nr:hypothetical protein [Lentisphaeria bacterium]
MPEGDKKAMMLGLGLDGGDGHKRLTKGENFVLAGGSEETHERMSETAIKVNEQLARKGKRLEDVSREEFHDMVRKASENWNQ